MNMVKKSEFIKALKDPKKAVEIARIRSDFTVGKIIYKNTAGLQNNLQGSITKFKTRKDTRSKTNNDLKTLISNLKTNGYVSLEYPFDDSLIEKIHQEYIDAINDDKFSFVRTEYDGKTYSRMIKTAWNTIPSSQKLVSEYVQNIFSEYFKGHFQVLDITAWRNEHVPKEITEKKELYASHWHCDGKNTAIMTLFLNLKEVTESDGPFMIQSRPRTKELVEKGFGNRHDYGLPQKEVEDQNHVVKHVGEMGSAMIVSTEECLHRASHPENGHFRDILQIRFIPSNDPLKDDWPDRCIGTDYEKMSKAKLLEKLQTHT